MQLSQNSQQKNKASMLSLVLFLVVLLLLVGVGFLAVKLYDTQNELKYTQTILEDENEQDKILTFVKLFVKEVLKSEGEVGFEAQLQLENSVRALNDEEILSQWRAFVDSDTEAGAQEEVKNLLEMLINKSI